MTDLSRPIRVGEVTPFTVEIDSDISVTDKLIVFKEQEYAVSEIYSLAFLESKNSVNGVPTKHHIQISMVFNDGRELSIWALHPILGRTRFKKLQKVYELLAAATLSQRLKPYTDALISVGYFDYNGIRIHADGIISSIKEPTKKADLYAAWTEKRISFGFSIGGLTWGRSDPNYIVVAANKPKLFTGSVSCGFDCIANRDSILGIIKYFDKSRVYPPVPSNPIGKL